MQATGTPTLDHLTTRQCSRCQETSDWVRHSKPPACRNGGVQTVLGDSHFERPPPDCGAGIGRGEGASHPVVLEVNVARLRRSCRRVVKTEHARGQCSESATWRGTLHVGRNVYVVDSCDRHRSALIDAEPLDGNSEKLVEYHA